MSGVLHPVGPEPEQTYWLRRALVLGTALLLVVIVALIATANGSGSAASAAPPPVVQPAGSTTSASPTASSSSATPKAGSPTATKTPAATKSPAATKTAADKKSGSPKAKTTAKPSAPVACAPAKLRTTLTGKQRLKPKQHATFKLSLINGSGAACVVKVSPADFTLTIYSGRDRIWTSAHCSTAVKPITTKVADEAAVEWSVAWNGRRSAKGCENRPEIPRAGTYKVTAHLHGSKAVTMRTILHA